MTLAGDRNSVRIRSANWAEDGPAIGDLCRAYRALLATRTQSFPAFMEEYYAAGDFEALLANLPRNHARPTGDILVAENNGQIVGCAMYYGLAPDGLCEIKRVFVHDAGRGLGVGRLLMEDAITRAAQDGHRRMVLDTVVTLTEAIALYERLGFAPAEPFYALDPQFRDAVRFFGRDLVAPTAK